MRAITSTSRIAVGRFATTLICSIAYSATGNVSCREDLAQETFIAAWAELRSLREREKLRGWLCGIVRHRIQRHRRDDLSEPVRQAASLEDAPESFALDPMPSEQAISREELAILWRSLEKIPEAYREPLILFYRQHQSIDQVAAALELSEDAVKQRVSGGPIRRERGRSVAHPADLDRSAV